MSSEINDWDLPIEVEEGGKQRNIPRTNYRLVGQTFRLALDWGDTYTLVISDKSTVLWGELGHALSSYDYLCMRANEFVWMVTFMVDDMTNVTVILDTLNNLTTVVTASVGQNKHRPNVVMHDIQFGAIVSPDIEPSVRRHGRSADLVGKKIAWKYSPVVTVTHIYHTPFSIRSSVHDMEPLPETATPEQIAECASREERWGRVPFEEPCTYVKINETLYMVTFREENRNRVDPAQGGGDLLLLIDTERVHDVGRGFMMGPDGKGTFNLITAKGRYVDSDDPLDTSESPYWI